MGRRILNRKDLRADFDAAERRTEDPEREDEEEEEGDDDEEEGDDDEEGGDDDEGDEGDDEASGGDDDDEEAPKKKKKKAAPKPKAPAKPRTRAVKVVRLRAIWGVFDNSNKMVASYDYPRRGEADAHAAKLTADKRNTHFVQMVKEPIEEKKEK